MAIDWDKLRIFHGVAEAGSFARAADALGLSPSAVSRQVSALEATLKVPLFHRHARGLTRTEQGNLLYQTAHDVFMRLSTTETMLMDSREKPRGTLRITSTIGLGSQWLTPRLQEFLNLYPDIDVRLNLTDKEADFRMSEPHVAIRIAAPVHLDLIRKRLFLIHYHVFASPTYIERRGSPATVDDLDHHDLLVYGEGASKPIRNANWLITVNRPAHKPRRPVLQVDNMMGLMRAAESGLGLAALPDYIARDNDSLITVLSNADTPSFTAYLVYPEEMRGFKRITAFRDFLLQRATQWEF